MSLFFKFVSRSFVKFLFENYHLIDHGIQPIKGLRDIQVYEIQSKSLRGRQFPDLESSQVHIVYEKISCFNFYSEKKHTARFESIREMLDEVEDVMSSIEESKEEGRAKTVLDTERKLKSIIRECQKLNKKLRKISGQV